MNDDVPDHEINIHYNGDWFCALWKCTSKCPMFLFCNLCHPIFLNVTKSIFRTSMRVSKEYKNNQIFV